MKTPLRKWKKPEEVRIGDPATMWVGTDRYAYYVDFKSPSGKTIYLRQKDWRPDVLSDAYRWSPKRGCYVNSSTRYVTVGEALNYLDPSF